MADLKDDGHTVERCRSGLRAAETLATNRGHRRASARLVRYWEVQLKFAKADRHAREEP